MYGKVSPMRGKSPSNETKQRMKENHADFKGSKHPKAKLTESDVKIIIDMFLNGIKTKDIAKLFNVNSGCISKIRSHRSWTHLTEGIQFPKS